MNAERPTLRPLHFRYYTYSKRHIQMTASPPGRPPVAALRRFDPRMPGRNRHRHPGVKGIGRRTGDGKPRPVADPPGDLLAARPAGPGALSLHLAGAPALPAGRDHRRVGLPSPQGAPLPPRPRALRAAAGVTRAGPDGR